MPINWDDLSTVTSSGFTVEEPPQAPREWTDFVPQRITETHLKEFGLT
jgi:hypothetical protein